MEAEKLAQYSVYVHIYNNGRLFILPSDVSTGFTGNLSSLKEYLNDIQTQDGILLYSVDESEYVQNRRVSRLLSLIHSYEIESQLVDPHPQVYGYNKSFAPYLTETIEVAEIDVEGLKQYLAEARQELRQCNRESKDYGKLKETCRSLRDRLKKAKIYLEKISNLHFELCVKSEDY
jgi:hypothetical protein